MNSLVTVAPPTFPVVPSVLGENPRRIPIGGKIRAGIKVLTAKAAQNPTARAIYDKGVEQGRKFEDVEAEIAKALPDLKHRALVPKNVPYFTVRRGDFGMPEVADMILEQYGEDRGDSVKRLYRFPVIFPVDSWQAIMPHALECYGATELKFWSQYSPDGNLRLCMTHAPVPTDPIAKRPIRIFGGRKQVTRRENEGRCEPEKCNEYQTRQCNLSGSFIFFIPGIPSVNAIELPTNSFYSMNNARQKLEMITFMRGGRISGYLDGKQTFWITKKLHEVSMIDPESGRPKRVAQWLIELEANIDVAGLLGSREDEEASLREAERALQVVNGHAAAVAEELRPSPGATNRTLAAENVGGESIDQKMSAPDTSAAVGEAEELKLKIKGMRQRTYELIQAMDINAEEFDRFAKQQWKISEWSKTVEGLDKAINELEIHKDDPERLRAKIEQTWQPF